MIVIAIGVLWLLVAGGVIATGLERMEWNHGICRETGEPWEYFDTDSQGGRGYKSGDYCVWISSPGIEKRVRRAK